MTKKEFTSKSKPISVAIEGQTLQAVPRLFTTGSVGFILNGKVTIQLSGGESLKLQVTGNLVVVGSKGWQEAAA